MKIHLELPKDWPALWLPVALQERLQHLLDLAGRAGRTDIAGAS
jgi:hypothetical protein